MYRKSSIFVVLCILVCTISVFQLGSAVTNFGVLDDASSIEPLLAVARHAGSVPIDRMFDNYSGPLGRPIAIFSFIAQVNVFGPSYGVFKAVNLGLHVLVAVFALLSLREFSRFASFRLDMAVLAGVTLWFLNPLWMSTLMYSVQQMAILAAAMSMIATYFCLRSATLTFYQSNRRVSRIICGIICALSFALALFSKENAATILIIWLLGYLLFSPKVSLSPSALFLALSILALLVVGLAIMFEPQVMSTFPLRDFGIAERLMTQVWLISQNSLSLVFVIGPGPSLFYDNIEPVLSVMDPRFLLGATGALLYFFITFKFLSSNISQIRVSGFLLLCYVLLHAPESSVVPLELHFDHRYYLPSLFLYIALGLAFSGFLASSNHSAGPLLVRGGLVIVAFIAVTSVLKTRFYSRIWSSPDSLAAYEWSTKPTSARAIQYAGHVAASNGQVEYAYELSEQANKYRKGETQWDMKFRNLYYACLADALYDDSLTLPQPSNPVFLDNDSIGAVWFSFNGGRCSKELAESWLRQNLPRLLDVDGREPSSDKTTSRVVSSYLNALVNEGKMLEKEVP